MDGSSKGRGKSAKPTAAQPRSAKAAEKTSAAAGAAEPKKQESSDDPFDIAAGAAGQKAIPCARKPVKGRTHRVVCPMCETQGFVPKSAVGKQVRCANPKCMVPIFTVPDPDADSGQRAPSRISDEALEREEKLAKPPSKKNPMVMWGIVGAVALLAALGLVAYLNTPPATDPGLNQAINIPISYDGEPEEDPDSDTPETPVDESATEVARLNKSIDQAIQQVIQAARTGLGNRDKGLCRQYSADLLLRLGREEAAETEFRQLKKNDSSKAYYQVEPVLAQYWSALQAGDSAKAQSWLNRAVSDGASIPPTGLLAAQAAVSLSAALAHTGKTDEAIQTIEKQQQDQTVTAELDNVRRGAWFAIAGVQRDHDQTAMPPVEVFSWNEPLKTAVGVNLAVHGQWQAAIQWAAAQSDPLTIGDTLAAVALQMQGSNSAADFSDELIAAAAKTDSTLQWRVTSILARNGNSDALWTEASARFGEMTMPTAAAMPDISQVIRDRTPSLEPLVAQAKAVADFAVTASSRQDVNLSSQAILHLTALLRSEIPSTAEVRKAVTFMEDSSGELRQQIAARFSLSNESRIKTQFTKYRNNLDRIARTAEQRRLLLVQLLHRIVRDGGSAALNQALATEGNVLLDELAVDSLSQFLTIAARSANQPLTKLEEADASLRVLAHTRIPAPEEKDVVDALQEGMTKMQAGDYQAALTAMGGTRSLPGFRSCLVDLMIENAARETSNADSLLMAIATQDNETWREDGYQTAALILARRKLDQRVGKWANDQRMSQTEIASIMHGLGLGIIDQLETLKTDQE